MSSTTDIHPSRISNIPAVKRKKKKPKVPKPQPASSSLTRAQLRKKIRDLSRLLNASSNSTTAAGGERTKASKLSATTRIDHERALAAYKLELSSQQLTSKRSTLEKRYHKVRFFERRKATRALSRLTKQLAALSSSDITEETESLRNQIHQAEIDLNYIMHYPALDKYISLYKSGEDKDTNKKRERIRKDIEKRMEDGTLEKGDALAAANAAEGFGGGPEKNIKKKKSQQSKGKPSADEMQDDEDRASDGGFFE
ncbi:hypothetical protein H072_1722 [Dactylellina haptotyla CBS 200.50]|uniref:rRNA-processing protein EFG1 n=1 Tax=Dactylellina haptotyla (strain CBS 200.50) TaxID=1284197 RepID=S8C999_DACHA|nr:hypothetical protein H072_1722 [Dactylellina haptotyla CBS 200.50]